MDIRAAAVLEFWFADTLAQPSRIESRMGLWFAAASSTALDAAIEQQFGELIELASDGHLVSWTQSARERLALILLLDQFRRNVYRGTPAAFARDAHALELSRTGIVSGMLAELVPIECVFFLMPLQHAEEPAAQEQSIQAFRELIPRVGPQLRDVFEHFFDYAVLHRDIIARFGRFPHRNALLGRASTPEEGDWLAAGAPDFGQG